MSSPAPCWQDVEDLLAQALDEVRSEDDALATISLAFATHKALLGELPTEEVADAEPTCICPPELAERGGYKGGCPVHGVTSLLPGGAR